MTIIVVLVIALAATLGPINLPAGAADISVCSLDVDVVISPGLSFTPTTATYTGEGGTISCGGGTSLGTVGPLSAAGVVGLFGGATCSQGIGGGTFTWGERTVDSTFTWLGNRGSLGGAAMSGTFHLAAIGSDCHAGPVTRAHLHSLAMISDTVPPAEE